MKSKVENNIVIIQETDSTNNYANHQISIGKVVEGTVFLAYSQKKGRGQLNNKWESEAGKNLTFSIVFIPDFLEITDQFLISKVVTLGISSVMKKLVKGLKIKWPNDIIAEDKKLGGILIENSIMSGKITNSVVGIGLNINQKQFVGDAPNPVSLQQITGEEYELLPLLNEIVSAINMYYRKLKDGRVSEINQLFLKEMYRFGTNYQYKCEKEIFTGKIVGVNEIGQLQILDSAGTIREFHFKEVEFII